MKILFPCRILFASRYTMCSWLHNGLRSTHAYKVARTTSFPKRAASSVFVRAESFVEVVDLIRVNFSIHRTAHMLLILLLTIPLISLFWSFGFSCGLCICMCAKALSASNALLLSYKEPKENFCVKVEDARQWGRIFIVILNYITFLSSLSKQHN